MLSLFDCDSDRQNIVAILIPIRFKLLTNSSTAPITQEIMRWELLEGNQLTRELANVPDQTALDSLSFLNQQCSFPEDQGIPAISAVLVAGIVYLTLRTKVSQKFMV